MEWPFNPANSAGPTVTVYEKGTHTSKSVVVNGGFDTFKRDIGLAFEGVVVNVYKDDGSLITSDMHLAFVHSGQTFYASFDRNHLFWSLDASKKSQYSNDFQRVSNGGFLEASNANQCFGGSGLPISILAAIWELSDRDKDGKLSEPEFYIARYLIDAKLSGQQLPHMLPEKLIQTIYSTQQSRVSPILQPDVTPMAPQSHINIQFPTPIRINQPTHLPAGQFLNAAHMPGMKFRSHHENIMTPRFTIESEGEEIISSIWYITKLQRKAYIKLFNEYCTNGFVNGNVALDLFSKSGLDRSILAKIWDISDVDKDNRLNGNEFLVASHLISLSIKGYSLPKKLPDNLVSSLRDPDQNERVNIDEDRSLNDIRGFRSIYKDAKKKKKSPVIASEIIKTIIHFSEEEIYRDDCIGHGSFGKVWKGAVRGEVVAVKDMTSTQANDVELWKKEVELLAYLKDEHYLVAIIGFCMSSECLTIVMEFMDRGSLYDIIHKDKVCNWSMLHKARILRHIAKGLYAVHELNIIHRDIKSMNILMNSNGMAKLADLGCSRTVKSELMTVGVGSPLWMAPEVLRSQNYAFPSDIYSYGIVAYEIFNESLPQFNKRKRKSIIPKDCIGFEFIRDCIQANPGRRPTARKLVNNLNEMIINFVAMGQDTLALTSTERLPPKNNFAEWFNLLLQYPKDTCDDLLRNGLSRYGD
eukprot:TRINITY_DN486_c1_g2_i1.p1 TRINITY_DN486_c1_g2~~TRINITY_DN486_c1_g2_i1.p1  ORF type:complete len:697 (-),score=121.04 TRINITY_DN486_c1_g2_i1:40-2130(-)